MMTDKGAIGAIDRHYDRVKRLHEDFLKKRAAAAKEYNEAIAPHLEEFKKAIAPHEATFKRKFKAAVAGREAAIERSSLAMQRRVARAHSEHGDKYDPDTVGIITVENAIDEK